jgi:hypothetical protein
MLMKINELLKSGDKWRGKQERLRGTMASGEIIVKIPCFRRTAIWFSDSSRRTSASISIKFSMPSCELYHIKTPESPGRLISMMNNNGMPSLTCPADLTTRFRRGFSETNLKQMREFYLAWPIRQTLSGESSYEAEAPRGGWSVRQLDRQISTLFYERTALSRNKAEHDIESPPSASPFKKFSIKLGKSEEARKLRYTNLECLVYDSASRQIYTWG